MTKVVSTQLPKPAHSEDQTGLAKTDRLRAGTARCRGNSAALPALIEGGTLRSLILAASAAASLAAAAIALGASTEPASAGPPWGPETPPFNIEVILHDISGGDGFGHVKFRQPNDDVRVISLDTWVRDLQPNHAYLLQRQVDLEADEDCADSSLSPWLTLGEGFALPPTPITTDDRGTGEAALFRDLDPPGPLAGPPPGMPFDIRFRVVDAVNPLQPVLQSECRVFTVTL